MNIDRVKNSEVNSAFNAIAALTKKESGIILTPEKSLMVQSRLKPRLKALGISSLEEYQEYVCSDLGIGERRNLISALTTNVSYFFREDHHFEILSKEIERTRRHNQEKLRLWSAGSSTGQEAYSIAMTVEKMGLRESYKILATDIDSQVLHTAKTGIYPLSLLESVPETLVKEFFSEVPSSNKQDFQISQQIREAVTFKKLNLLADWPISGKFDFIFCRNVVIYFDEITRQGLWPRFSKALKPSGVFFLGHSERIADPEKYGFKSIGPTAYQLSSDKN